MSDKKKVTEATDELLFAARRDARAIIGLVSNEAMFEKDDRITVSQKSD